MADFWKAAKDALSPIFRPAGSAIDGVQPGDWASPQQPIRPVLQQNVGVRSWDFSPGINLRYTPRGDSPINFAQLRNVANSFDLCRLMIETRKDQVVNRPWVVRVKPLPGETKKDRLVRESQNPNVSMLTKLLQRPDGSRAFPVWIRTWLDQLLVYDAPCIYPVRSVLGNVIGLRVISGATITPLLDEQGFIPQPPNPAYQQIILGIPTTNLTAGKEQKKEFTADQLIYSPRNPRVDSRWGYSPVEQIITTLQIASSRQQFLKNYYAEGNIPEGVMPMPESWTVAQIKDFQNWFDGLLAGNLAKKRRLIAVPDSKKGVQFSKDKALTDMTDDYLIRVVAFAFSITPQNLIKQVNRGTAQESSDVAQIEGLEPVLKHIESVMNLDIIQGVFGIDDCEFAYADEREMDPLKQAQVDKIYAGTISTINEIRTDRGMDPRPEPEADMLGVFTPTGFVPLGQQAQQQSDGDDEEEGDDKPPSPTITDKQNKVKKNSEILMRGQDLTPASIRQCSAMDALCAKFLSASGKKAAQAAAKVYSKFGKADVDKDHIEEILLAMELEWEQLGLDVTPLLEAAALAGVQLGSEQVFVIGGEPEDDYVSTAKSHAQQFAEDRGAELVGMKRQADGSFIENPDAMWAISDTTREDMRKTIAQAFEEGWSVDQLSAAIEGAYVFSSDRAAMIAKTEVTRAQSYGNLQSWQASGVILKVQWQTSADHECCDECDDYEDEGLVEPGHQFAPMVFAPGAHPNCNCALVVREVKKT